MELGKRIKKRREDLKLSQDELAKRLGYKSRSSINKIELGLSDIYTSKLLVFAEVLQTSPIYLLGLDDKPNINERNTPQSSSCDNIVSLNPYETKVITAYRDKPEMQPAVDTLLGVVDDEEYIPVAARNGKSGKVKVTSSPEERKVALDKELPGVSTPKTPDEF